MLDFLHQTGSFLSMNMYPFLAYMEHPEMGFDYAMGNGKAAPVTDRTSGLRYTSLLDAQLDATYYAMEALGFPGVSLKQTEHGWASGGRRNNGRPLTPLEAEAATKDKAQAYMT
ncbi:hypothetical protein U9M48_015501 [Paspalum notatum var. saurae]